MNRTNRHFTAVVIPCLNEERTLANVCRSLGFGIGQQVPDDTALVLVDNGSADATVEVAKDVKRRSRSGSVVVTAEPERGYVPPRHRGNRVAIDVAAERNIPAENVFIIQADADTLYSEGYVDVMKSCALSLGRGRMLDARTEYPDDFTATCHEYIALCNQVDAEFESALSEQPGDVVVDDKACGYWASDYELWGGHRREYTADGDEIHSETTRLYIRARAHGAGRHLCEEAVAQHSARRIISDPAFSFATAGFPREGAFKSKWKQRYMGPNDIVDFCNDVNRPKIEFAIGCRRAHMRGLFDLLTIHVDQTLARDQRSGQPFGIDIGMPARDGRIARERPGILLEDVFRRVDEIAFD